MYALVLLLISGDISRLGNEDWETRDGAQRRLCTVGILAVPHLIDAAACDDPEVRRRVDELLRPWRRFARDYLAARLLLDPAAEIDAESLWRDADLRHRLHRVAARLRVPPWESDPLRDEHYVGGWGGWGGWFETTLASHRCLNALEMCRARLGTTTKEPPCPQP